MNFFTFQIIVNILYVQTELQFCITVATSIQIQELNWNLNNILNSGFERHSTPICGKSYKLKYT